METLKKTLEFIDSASPNIILCLIAFALVVTIIHAYKHFRNRDTKKELIRSARHNSRIQRESIGMRIKK